MARLVSGNMDTFSVMHWLSRARRRKEESFTLEELDALGLRAATAVGSSAIVEIYPGAIPLIRGEG
jgi:hypothetical protein